MRPARAEDAPAIEALLASERLPPYGLLDHLGTFLVLEKDGRVVGSAGLEVYGQAALLRSVVVAPGLRKQRLGERLAVAALEEARRRDVRRVYLFTMHAGQFFARYGFREVTLEEFEPAVRQSIQYRGVSSMPELRARLLGDLRKEWGSKLEVAADEGASPDRATEDMLRALGYVR